jgi:pimeloyl-ACP methyl ester carboxylesterase
MPDFFTTPQGRRIAFEQIAGRGPGVVFLGGFRSDMTGTKAAWLADWAAARGRACLRFDYSGHGASSGAFEDGCIGDWAQDAVETIAALTTGPQVLVGSSMGGWIALLVARRLPPAALVGIAAAPDFTEDGFWANFTPDQRAELAATGRVMVPSDYEDPYAITRRLIEDGRDHLVLRRPLRLDCPVRLLQGAADTVVTPHVALTLFDHLDADDATLTLVKGADHRFSTEACLDLLGRTLDGLP